MVVRQDIDNTTAIVTVTLTRDEYKPKLDAELKRYRQKAPIKGFRPGHVPMDTVKRMYGPVIFQDVIQEAFAEQLMTYLRDSRLHVLGQPLPAEDQPALSLDFKNMQDEYTVAYEVGHVPNFEVKGLDKSYTYERFAVSNVDALAADDLEYMRKSTNTSIEAEDNIQENDMVYIESQEMEGDHPKADGVKARIPVLVKDVANEALKAHLLNLKKGDSLRFNPRNLENQEKEEMYRKYILQLADNDDRTVGDDFQGTIDLVNRIQAANLDQAFFKDNFGTENQAEAIEQLKANIRKYYDARSNALLVRQIQEHLMELNPIELPEKFLKRWMEASGTVPASTSDDKSQDNFSALLTSVRWTILRDDMIDEFGITVSDSEVRSLFSQRIKGYFAGNGAANLPESIFDEFIDRMMKTQKEASEAREEIEVEKLFKAIIDQVTIQDVPMPSNEIEAALEELHRKSSEAAAIAAAQAAAEIEATGEEVTASTEEG